DAPLAVALRAVGPNDLVLSGRIPQGHKPLLRVYEVPNAAAFTRSLLIEALERAGVTVDASPLGAQSTANLAQTSAETSRLPQVAELASPPFAESARLILKVSHNLHASTLPLLIAAKHQKRTLAEGLALQHDVLAKLGVEVDTISFGGGAGGSQADCVTPRATVQLLRSMRKHPAAMAYREALPVLGVDGTLAESAPADSPARGKVQAKTGTYFWENTMNKRFLLTSKALAGYITTAQNRELAFALFVNRAHIEKPSETVNAGKALGRIAEAIYLEH
ncbi:MAG: D-alanyl-D-alanine carboxypeptidase/D-alanyl-D-alanine-endopeptidase, partial [Planctomycetaceae bacterium]